MCCGEPCWSVTSQNSHHLSLANSVQTATENRARLGIDGYPQNGPETALSRCRGLSREGKFA